MPTYNNVTTNGRFLRRTWDGFVVVHLITNWWAFSDVCIVITTVPLASKHLMSHYFTSNLKGTQISCYVDILVGMTILASKLVIHNKLPLYMTCSLSIHGRGTKKASTFPIFIGNACSQCCVDYVHGQTSCCTNYMLQQQFEFQFLPKVHWGRNCRGCWIISELPTHHDYASLE